jgi:hypothetical protein
MDTIASLYRRERGALAPNLTNVGQAFIFLVNKEDIVARKSLLLPLKRRNRVFGLPV